MKTKILIGDCIEQMKGLADGSVDAVIADPPYGTTACKWDTVIPFAPMWEQLKRIVKDRSAIVLFGSQPFTSALVMSNPKMFKYEWVWEKTQAVGHLNAWRRPMLQHEGVCVFSNLSTNYYPQLTEKLPENMRPVSNRTKTSACYGLHRLDIHRCPTNKSMPRSVLRFANQQNQVHPTQKPVALLEYLIKTYTKEYETVLDFTMGSGTTGVACAKTGRNFIGIDLDPEYAEIARKRIEAVKYVPKEKVLPRYQDEKEVRRKPEQLELFK
jgi:site-specific DNA-methyltransferase (adenine-specific)